RFVLSYIENYLNKLVAQKDNPTWRKVVVGNKKVIQVDVTPEMEYEYDIQHLHGFIDAYGDYLRNGITVQVIDNLINALKAKIPYYGKIIEAAREVKAMYEQNRSRYASLPMAAQEFFDAHVFVV